ncbi:SPL family radical SAM protein [Desulfurococcus mucosus]|uniref:Radical SAM domain protein n=1 Tax=Desulfurococcus mucosus (strain ATCC 35584 / DSM 2162 / JCM 9187 / O7/1) TaxID=765177 RepID=E8R9B5_DESM0|nr:radical SAM protein [Desulfurococcus mucosus]ADV65091.1 Radical SAM domain protein [Desulfurococcus mucosus DSM 2162]
MNWAFKVIRVRCETALSRSGLPGLDYALNPYTGCAHACIYCYARMYTRNREVSENWGSIVLVKENIVDVLKREVSTHPRGTVGVGTVTDAYQPVEAVYRLTRRSLELLLKHGFHASIQTKNPLILRDIDILTRYRGLVDVGFTVTTLDSEVSRFIEPRAPPPGARVRALEKLSEEGIPVWVFYGPIIPGLNSDEATIEGIIELSRRLNATLYYDPLHVKKFMETPGHALYTYAGRIREEWRSVERKIREECRKLGVVCKPGFANG